jgi:hypothetical protein
MNIVETKIYHSLKDFTDAISYNGELYNEFSSNYIFRGQPSAKYELVPSALRCGKENLVSKLYYSNNPSIDSVTAQILDEYLLLKNFYVDCDKNSLLIPNIDRIRDYFATYTHLDLFRNTAGVWLPRDFYEIAGLAQHYGLPTRLLDWTRSIYTALYFSATYNLGKDENNDYMVLWAFNPKLITLFVPPLKIIVPEYHGNPNLAAQQGVFTLWEVDKLEIKGSMLVNKHPNSLVDRRPLNELIAEYLTNNGKETGYDNLFYKIMIPSNESIELLKYLSFLGYDSAKLFPGYYGVVKNIKESILLMNK